MLGGFLALLAAATFALNNTSVRIGVLTGSVAQAMAITVPIGVPIFLLATVASGHLATLAGFSGEAVLYLAIAGIIHFVWGRYCNYRATKAIGVNLVAPVQQLSLIITLTLAVGLLGEHLTALQIVGIVLVVLGPASTLERPERRQAGEASTRQRPLFKPNYAEGYLFAALSATGYGASPILVRSALAQAGLGGSLAGGLIAYAAATVVTALLLLRPGQLAHVRAIERGPAKWFTISGILVCLSQMFNYMALAVAPVSVVTPILRLSLVLRVVFASIFTPHHEVFGLRVIIGTLLSLLGAIALTVPTGILLSFLSLPDAVAAIARWHWP